MRESLRSNFYGFGLPVAILLVLCVMTISNSRKAIFEVVVQARNLTVSHTFDSGVSVWSVRIR